MLIATELRIGNLVNYKIVDKLDERKEWFEPCKIDAVDLQVINSDYQPIPLTEEWLLKFGVTPFDGNFIVDRFRLIYKPIYNYYYVVDKYSNFYYSKVEFVHEWQNLFYSMNGKELTLTK
jgi:hypothetical protein